MIQHPRKTKLRLIPGTGLVNLHDQVMSSLDLPEKAGITKLLDKNNKVFKKFLHKYLSENCYQIDNHLMTTLDHLLDVHAKECYTIGYLDRIGKEQTR